MTRRPPFKILSAILFIFLVLPFTGCGKKGSPVAPEAHFPAPVTDLKAWPKEASVFLGWTIPNKNTDESKLEDLLGFRVFRESRPLKGSCYDCPFQFQIVAEIDIDYPRGARVEGGRVLWQDMAIQPQHEYNYYVLAYSSYLVPSPRSNLVKVFWDEPPPAPGNVKIRSDHRALEITWEFSPPAGRQAFEPAGFNVYRRTEGGRYGFDPLNPSPLKEKRVLDMGLENGRKYFYQVSAVENFRGTLIEGPASAEASGVPEKQALPLPPSGLFAVFQEGGIALRWDESREADVAGYNVYRREEGETSFRKINPQPVKEAYFLDAAAAVKKAYDYYVTSVDVYQKESEPSRGAEIPPEPPAPQIK